MKRDIHDQKISHGKFSKAADDFYARTFYSNIVQTMLTHVPIARSILDIGCGPGDLSALVAQAYPTTQYTCVDLNADYLLQAALRVGDILGSCGTVAADITKGSTFKTKLPQGVDVVLCANTTGYFTAKEL